MANKSFEQGLIVGMQLSGTKSPDNPPISPPVLPVIPPWIKPSDWIDISIDVPANGISMLLNDLRDATYTFIGTTTGLFEVDTLTITSGASVAGNITITLNGVNTNIALLSTDNTPALVATKIRNTTFSKYTLSGSGANIVFTSTVQGINVSPVYSSGTTGATGIFTVNTNGGGLYQIDWGDGTIAQYNGGAKISHTYTVNSGAICSRGYTTFKLKVTPITGDLLSFKIPFISGTFYYGILWCIFGDNSKVTNTSSMFSNGTNYFCHELEKIQGNNLSSLVDASNMCNLAYSLYDVTMLNTTSLTTLSAAFSSCSNLQVVNIPNTSALVVLSQAFQYCNSLRAICLGTTGVDCYMYNTFYQCLALQYFSISDASKVKSFNSTFYGCQELYWIEINNMASATTIVGMCYNCYNLKYAKLSNISSTTCLASGLFYNCYSLAYVYIDARKLTDLSTGFYGCYALINISISNASNLTTLNQAFYGCTALVSVEITGAIRVSDMSNTFNGCKSLTNIIILNLDSVTTLGSAFSGCTSLVSAELGTSGMLANIANIFYGCSNILTFNLHNTSNVSTMSYMLYNCTSIVGLPYIDMSKSTTLQSAFYGCSALITVELTSTFLVTNYASAFYGCSALRSIKITNLASSSTTFSDAFRNCYALTSLVLGSLNYVSTLSVLLCVHLKQFTFSVTNFVNASVSFILQNSGFTADSLNAFFTSLPTVTGTKSITITGSVGAATCNKAIATAKGWTVT